MAIPYPISLIVNAERRRDREREREREKGGEKGEREGGVGGRHEESARQWVRQSDGYVREK